MERMTDTPHAANARPRAQPTTASSALSTKYWRIRRDLPAPSAETAEPWLRRVRDVVWWVAGGAGLSTLISATVGVGSLWLGHRLEAAELAPTWTAWWVGDVLGALVVAPLLFAWSAPLSRFDGRRIGDALLLLAAVAGISVAVFLEWTPVGALRGRGQAYLVFPFLAWAALRGA